MTIYVDTSALVKLLVEEPESERAARLVADADRLATSRIAVIEARRAVARLVADGDRERVLDELARRLDAMHLVELTPAIAERAAVIAERHPVRSLDAIHLASADLGAGGLLPLLTFDVRQARVAEELGHLVLR